MDSLEDNLGDWGGVAAVPSHFISLLVAIVGSGDDNLGDSGGVLAVPSHSISLLVSLGIHR